MLTRRKALAALTLAATPTVAFANIEARPNRRFALIILRGAMDGLAAVPPLADPDYAALRTSLALGTPDAPDGALPLDGKFWLHPALAPVHPFFARGEMTVVHAMASPYRDRSHFDAQNMLESGMTRPGWSSDGWLNRTLAAQHATSVHAIAFTPTLPLVLKGAAPASNWQPEGKQADIHEAVAHMYSADPRLAAAYTQGMEAKGMIDQIAAGGAPKHDFAAIAGLAGRALATDDGPNVAVLELGGWDTHVGQGAARGRLAAALANLAGGVESMHAALGPRWHDTVIMAITEFGRTAHPNGTGGTDHGTATAGFAFGGALAGGRVIADWPGLAAGALYQNRDLAPTTDFRSFVKGVLGDHLGVTAAALERDIFPDSASARPMQGLVRS